MKYFEDFFPNNGTADIFEKAYNIDKYKRECNPAELESLGVENLGASAKFIELKELDGQKHKTIMLGSNSYLNLTTHPKVISAAKAACDKYGYGMGAVSLYTGITDLHRELEGLIADFYGAEDAVVFPSGYGANIGIISALCGKGDVIINDANNHASIFDGCKLSDADVKIYPHNNMKYLERILKRIPDEQKGRLIIVDGVFSMHGDTAPLDEIVDLAEKYSARIMVDDAHGLGIVGDTGRGTAELYRVTDKIDLHVGMLSKTPGAIGGYCAANKEIVQYLRYYCRTYFFSTALPAPIVAGLIEVFKLLKDNNAGRDKLLQNVKYMLSSLNELGFDTGETTSAIIPIIVGDERKLALFNNDLRKNGVYTNIVTYPAVRRKECRLRLCIMNSLTKDDMDEALSVLEMFGKKYEII